MKASGVVWFWLAFWVCGLAVRDRMGWRLNILGEGGKRRIRCAPQPHSKSMRMMAVFGGRECLRSVLLHACSLARDLRLEPIFRLLVVN